MGRKDKDRRYLWVRDTLQHYGKLRRSGRYPWGSGGNKFISDIERLEGMGMTEKEIASALGISTTTLRTKKALIKGAISEDLSEEVKRLRKSGMSYSVISKKIGVPERTVATMDKEFFNAKFKVVKRLANFLKSVIDKVGAVDVGKGVSVLLGVSTTKLNQAVAYLEMMGYKRYDLKVKQLGTGKTTTVKVLAKPEMTFQDLVAMKDKIQVPIDPDKTPSFTEEKSPLASKYDPGTMVRVPKKNVRVVNSQYDGLIEVRSTADYLSLGPGKRFSQVRVLVGPDKYAKGLAIVRGPHEPPFDKLPKGVDMVVHTSKKASYESLKDWETPTTPFKAATSPVFYTDGDGNTRLSAMNIVREAGQWDLWKRASSSQFLSKQPVPLIERQLRLKRQSVKHGLEAIRQIRNPVVRSELLRAYADSIDKMSYTMEAAALPKQRTSVLIPDLDIKPNEVFAPNYNTGERIALVRYPHAGPFEIPVLTVNNNNKKLRESVLPHSDGIVVNPEVARQLSGADFDGDTVVTFPYNSTNPIKALKPYKELLDFEPKDAYPYKEGIHTLPKKRVNMEMGKISNLITDMSIAKAPPEDIINAVKHSMVVIDAYKHKLDYKQSEIDHGIHALVKKYQGSNGGASTIVSKAKSPVYVDQRNDRYSIDPETGEKIYSTTGKTYTRKDGTVVRYKTKTYKMLESDPLDLVKDRNSPIEMAYAKHAKELKSLANQTRLESLTNDYEKPSAATKLRYKNQIDSVTKKIQEIEANAPRERQAQIIANVIYRERVLNSPEMSPEQKKSERAKVVAIARARVGAKKPTLTLTPEEFEAMEAGVFTKTMLNKIVNMSEPSHIIGHTIKSHGLSEGSKSTILSLKKTYTNREIANMLNLPMWAVEEVS